MEEDDVFSGIKTSISKYPVRTDNIFLEKTKWHGAAAWDTPLNFRVCARWKRSSEILQNYILLSILQKTFPSFKKIFCFFQISDLMPYLTVAVEIRSMFLKTWEWLVILPLPLMVLLKIWGSPIWVVWQTMWKKFHSGRGRGLAGGSQSPLGLYSVYTLQK